MENDSGSPSRRGAMHIRQTIAGKPVERAETFDTANPAHGGRAKFMRAPGAAREGGAWSGEVFLAPENVAVSPGSHAVPHRGARA